MIKKDKEKLVLYIKKETKIEEAVINFAQNFHIESRFNNTNRNTPSLVQFFDNKNPIT